MKIYRFVYSGTIDIEEENEDEAWNVYNGLSDEEKIDNIGYEELDCVIDEEDGTTKVLYY